MTTSHALAFYDPLGDPEYDQLLQLWLANWRSHGWDARVVGPEWIDRHPHAHILRQATANLPTPLDRGYEQACFLRWAALPAFMSHHSIPAAFLGDFDICSLSFTPALASSLLPNSLLGGGALLVDALTANLLPAAIALTAYPSSTQPSSLLPAHANDALALKFLAARSTLLHEFTAPIGHGEFAKIHLARRKTGENVAADAGDQCGEGQAITQDYFHKRIERWFIQFWRKLELPISGTPGCREKVSEKRCGSRPVVR